MIKDRLFKIWGYTVSHSTLLIRSERQYDDVEYPTQYKPNGTIDIEFSGVNFIKLNSSFILKKIRIVSKRKLSKDYVKMDNYSKVYEIEHDEGFSYIIASSIVIGKSEWDDTDRIMNPDLSYPEILKDIVEPPPASAIRESEEE